MSIQKFPMGKLPLTAQLHQNLTEKGAAFLIKNRAFGNRNVCWITIEADRVDVRAEKGMKVVGSLTFAELLEALDFDLKGWEERQRV